MNILWLSHLLPYPPKGGVKQRSYNLLKEISKYHSVFIIAFSQKSHQATPKEKQAAIEGLSKLGKVVNVYTFDSDKSSINRALLATKSLFTTNPYTVNWLTKAGVGSKILQTVEENNIELVHFDTISWAAYLKYTKGCKLVLNHHNIESHMMLRRAQKEGNLLKKLYYYQEGWKLESYEKKVCNQFDLNITCSTKDTMRLNKMIPNLCSDTIPNGVDLNYFKPIGLAQRSNSMVFAGGLSWYPNIAAIEFFAKHVWPELEKEITDISMTVIGRNPPKWLLDFSSNNDNFTVTGFVNDVRPYIDQASIYICPIDDGGGTKLKVLDALAMGKAIIAHPIACEGIDVTEFENVIFAKTPEDYVTKIKMLLNDEPLRKKLGVNGRNLIEQQYDYINIGKKLNRIYTDL